MAVDDTVPRVEVALGLSRSVAAGGGGVELSPLEVLCPPSDGHKLVAPSWRLWARPNRGFEGQLGRGNAERNNFPTARGPERHCDRAMRRQADGPQNTRVVDQVAEPVVRHAVV